MAYNDARVPLLGLGVVVEISAAYGAVADLFPSLCQSLVVKLGHIRWFSIVGKFSQSSGVTYVSRNLLEAVEGDGLDTD